MSNYEDNGVASAFSVDDDTAYIHTESGGVSQVSVSITISTKALGADAFIKMEETHDFGVAVLPGEAAIKRSDILDVLRDQVLQEAQKTVKEIREAVAAAPRGNVSVHPATPQAAPQGAKFGQAAPAAGPAATVAVANGATASAGGVDWRSVPSKFGDGELRFISTASMPTEQMEADVATWLRNNGLNPDAFKMFDNRVGPRGLEAGQSAGCVAAVKVARDAEAYVTPDVAKAAICRVKHNSNGTNYIYWTKEGEAAFKFGALNPLKTEA